MLAVGLVVLIPATSLCLMCSWFFRNSDRGFHYPEPWRCLMAVLAPFFIALHGLRRKSVCPSGALAGMMVGFFLTISSMCFFIALLVFFFSGSKATKYRSHLKQKLEDDFKEGGQRDWRQVISNGGVAAWMAVLYIMEVGCVDLPIDFSRHYGSSWLGIAILGSLACCCGDTFSSEFGTVFGAGKPRLITTFEPVPRGTNGGVSVAGTLASGVGGLLVGLGYAVGLFLFVDYVPVHPTPPQWPVILVGMITGILGSIIDSLLGAVFQFSGYSSKLGKVVATPGPDVTHISGKRILDNDSVNLLSSLFTALLSPFIASALVWPRFA